MENLIDRQVTEAAATLLVGLALGLLYEVFGELRRCGGSLLAVVLDLLFCIVFAAALFYLGMGPGNGQLRLYMPILMFAGGGFWIRVFGRETRKISAEVFRRTGKCVRLLLQPLKKLGKRAKKLKEIIKNIF